MALSHLNITQQLETAYKPKRTKDGLVDPTEYKQVIGRKIPDLEVEVTWWGVDKPITSKEKISTILGKRNFLIAAQPGVSTKEEANQGLYSKKPGAPGCTGEFLALDEVVLT